MEGLRLTENIQTSEDVQDEVADYLEKVFTAMYGSYIRNIQDHASN